MIFDETELEINLHGYGVGAWSSEFVGKPTILISSDFQWLYPTNRRPPYGGHFAQAKEASGRVFQKSKHKCEPFWPPVMQNLQTWNFLVIFKLHWAQRPCCCHCFDGNVVERITKLLLSLLPGTCSFQDCAVRLCCPQDWAGSFGADSEVILVHKSSRESDKQASNSG